MKFIFLLTPPQPTSIRKEPKIIKAVTLKFQSLVRIKAYDEMAPCFQKHATSPEVVEQDSWSCPWS